MFSRTTNIHEDTRDRFEASDQFRHVFGQMQQPELDTTMPYISYDSNLTTVFRPTAAAVAEPPEPTERFTLAPQEANNSNILENIISKTTIELILPKILDLDEKQIIIKDFITLAELFNDKITNEKLKIDLSKFKGDQKDPILYALEMRCEPLVEILRSIENRMDLIGRIIKKEIDMHRKKNKKIQKLQMKHDALSNGNDIKIPALENPTNMRVKIDRITVFCRPRKTSKPPKATLLVGIEAFLCNTLKINHNDLTIDDYFFAAEILKEFGNVDINLNLQRNTRCSIIVELERKLVQISAAFTKDNKLVQLINEKIMNNEDTKQRKKRDKVGNLSRVLERLEGNNIGLSQSRSSNQPSLLNWKNTMSNTMPHPNIMYQVISATPSMASNQNQISFNNNLISNSNESGPPRGINYCASSNLISDTLSISKPTETNGETKTTDNQNIPVGGHLTHVDDHKSDENFRRQNCHLNEPSTEINLTTTKSDFTKTDDWDQIDQSYQNDPNQFDIFDVSDTFFSPQGEFGFDLPEYFSYGD